MAYKNDLSNKLEDVKSVLEQNYVVENLKTGEKYVTDYFSAVNAIHGCQPYFDVWYTLPNSDLKMYPVKDLGPAGEVLYGPKKP